MDRIGKQIIGFVVFALSIVILADGCRKEEENHSWAIGADSIPAEPDCTCPAEPTFYMVQIEYKDHQEKKRSFPFKVEWKSSWGWREIPDTIYATKGISIDGSFSWYYSLKEPYRSSNGLITIEQVDGPTKQVDFKEVEITLLPCRPSDKIDELSNERFLEGKEYIDHRTKKCPYHKEGGWKSEWEWKKYKGQIH